MKNLFTLAIFGLTAVSGWAQGSVTFQNGGTITFPAPALNRYVYTAGPIGLGDAADAARRLTGTNYCAGLWFVPGGGNAAQLALGRGGSQAVNPTNVVNLAIGNFFNFRAATTADANKGVWLPPPNSATAFELPGIGVGESATLQVRVWDAATYGRSEAGYLAALTAGVGVGFSLPFDYTVPAPGSTPDKYYMTGLRAFVLIPEPSTIALGVLGAASLLLLRRRK